MNDLDELFRGGLGDRKPEVPKDLWDKIADRRSPLPEGEELDRLFAGKLAHRQPSVPAGIWERIMAARRPYPIARYAALVLLLLAVIGTLFWAMPQEQNNAEKVAVLAGGGPFTIPVPTNTSPAQIATEGAQPAVGDLPAVVARNETPANTPTVTRSAREKPAPGQVSLPVTLPPSKAVSQKATVVRAIPSLIPTALEISGQTGLSSGLLFRLTPPTDGSFRSSGRSRFQAEFLLGAAYANQRFGQVAENARELRNAREVSEFPQLSYQASVRLQYRLRPRIRLLTGLTFVDIRNQLEYEQSVNGQTELMRTNNHLRMLEVPVLASYTITGRRLRLNVNAGPIVNLYTAVDGQYLHPGFAEPQSLNDGAGYRSNVGIGWTTSLTTTYLIGKDRTTQLLLEPFFKSYPGSFTARDAPLSEHYWLAGLQVGLRKSL